MSNKELDYETKYKYLLADYDNYRKRVEKEAENRIMAEKARLLLKIINLRDDFERALTALEKGKDTNAIMDGLKAILKNIDNILKEEGVDAIEAEGKKFDPNLHEVVSIITNNKLPDYTITNELRKGYMLNNKVIRPSLVEVSRNEDNNINIE
ncbi:MAG: nucleotide exchange factor GrpE [Candidatus Nitrosothermus koennekii]|nr:MAG: nucleotide exchange factor GrpE [Candidatus Nitrosothermus koennekii]